MGRQSAKVRAQRTASAVQSARTLAISQMNPALLAEFRAMEQSSVDVRSSNLRYYWEQGRRGQHIKEHPEIYEDKAIELLETAMSTQARAIRKAMMFARTYTESELEWLISIYNTETGFQLHWGHVSYLVSLHTRILREAWSREAVSKLWSPLDLHAAIKKREGRPAGHGRNHKVPSTVEAQVRQMLVLSDQWLAKQAAVWNGDKVNVFKNILETAGEEMTDELSENLRCLLQSMEKLETCARDNMEQIKRALEYVEAQRTEQRRIEEADAAAAEEEVRQAELREEELREEEARRHEQARAQAPPPPAPPRRHEPAPDLRDLDIDTPQARATRARQKAHA